MKIELADADADAALQVVHFADGEEIGDVVADVDVDGIALDFIVEGFSAYAKETEETQNRPLSPAVHFIKIEDQIIKNGSHLLERNHLNNLLYLVLSTAWQNISHMYRKNSKGLDIRITVG